jgi:hypothetical protein
MSEMLCQIDSVLRNISHIQSECENIMHNIVNPEEQCYGFE